jgi:hypothetical protein
MLALLWLPVTSDCLLEQARLIDQDACCETHATSAGHGYNAADGICQIESSSCPLPKTQPSPSAPFLFRSSWITLTLSPPPTPIPLRPYRQIPRLTG